MKILVLGASDNPARYSYKAVHTLLKKGHDVVPVGVKKSSVGGKEIITHREIIPGIDIITLYVGPENQKSQGLYDYILDTKPQRIIFNPGTENPELVRLAEDMGIEATHACTLVMAATGEL